MRTHTSYKVSKRLKEFMGESSPEPLEDDKKAYYGKDLLHYATDEIATESHRRTFNGFAYRLEDLLSRPFCEAFEKRMLADCGSQNGNKRLYRDVPVDTDLRDGLCRKYYTEGLPAVEAALMKMMEGE